MQGKDFTTYLLVIASVIVLLIIAGAVIFALRKKLFSDEESADGAAVGVLETMREMWTRGEISEDEFRTAQAAIVAKASGSRSKPASPSRPQTPVTRAGELRARPGYDLTGEPLPRSTTRHPPRREPPTGQ
ncbi:MAG: cbb3-type cytochrome oxidase assembly protein [Phycisphaerales bacterium]|nr:cbb3-type cytochrome oxidase assembly protein [Phycisphaerales bacterium]